MDEVRLGKNHKSSPNFAWQPLHCLRAWKNLDSITGGNYCVSETEIFTTAVTLRMKFRLVWNRSCCFLSQIWDLVVKSQCTMRNWSEKDWLENNKIIFTHSLVDVVGPFFTLSLDDLSYAWNRKTLQVHKNTREREKAYNGSGIKHKEEEKTKTEVFLETQLWKWQEPNNVKDWDRLRSRGFIAVVREEKHAGHVCFNHDSYNTVDTCLL